MIVRFTRAFETGTKGQAMMLSEADEQKLVINWFSIYSKQVGICTNLLFHIPNEGVRSPATCNHLYSQGMRKGVPDLFLAVPAGGKAGLFIEMKRIKGAKVSKEQKEFINNLLIAGYDACICYGADEAINRIKAYINSGISH